MKHLSCAVALVTSLTLTPAFALSAPQPLSYVGTDTCLSCHDDMASHLLSGHNYKLSPIENGQAPALPYTDVSGALPFVTETNSSLGDPKSFSDVSYVIGGYMRTVMFLDKNGYLFAGDNARLDLPSDGKTFSADLRVTVPTKKPGADTRPYVCGRCHTTGWQDYTSVEGDLRHRHRQNDLPGMTGTFEQAGVQCEACHGAGSNHVAEPSSDNITKIASGRSRAELLADDMAFGKAISCGECHSEDGERHYPSFMSHFNAQFGGDSLGGRIKDYPYGGRYPLDGLLGMDPDTGEAKGAKQLMRCTDCHDPHKSTVNRDKPEHQGALRQMCTDCHSDIEFAQNDAGEMHQMAALCTDCHMPKSAHIFKIDLSKPSSDTAHYSSDGKFRQPWLRASDACKQCHADDYDQRASRITTIHK